MPFTNTNLDSLLPVLNKLHDGVILTDSKLDITFANQAAHDIFGYKSKGLIGLNISALIPEDRRHSHQHQTASYMANPTPRLMNPHMRLEGSDQAGETIPILVSLDPIETESGRMMMVMVRDIRSVVRMETELFHAKKLETIGKTSAGMIHDLKNVLHVITNSTYFARKYSDGDALKHLESIDTQTQVANRMLTSLLGYLQQGSPEPQRINLGEALCAIEPVAHSLLPGKVKLQLLIKNGDIHIHATTTTIEQIIFNLLFNAGDAVEGRSEPEINIELSWEKEGARASLCVTDNGCGMGDEVKENLFKTFFTTKEKKGTGLGLAGVYGAVIDMGGEIIVKSREGEGTSFIISLPAD